MPTADEFRTELYRMMHEAFKQDCEYVEIEAGELHRRLGGYPTGENRMPNCCQVMRAEVATDVGDVKRYNARSRLICLNVSALHTAWVSASSTHRPVCHNSVFKLLRL